MGGIKNICKLYGGITFTDQHGNKTEWVWDHDKDEPILKSEMDKQKWELSEHKKWEVIKCKLEKEKLKKEQGKFDF